MTIYKTINVSPDVLELLKHIKREHGISLTHSANEAIRFYYAKNFTKTMVLKKTK